MLGSSRSIGFMHDDLMDLSVLIRNKFPGVFFTRTYANLQYADGPIDPKTGRRVRIEVPGPKQFNRLEALFDPGAPADRTFTIWWPDPDWEPIWKGEPYVPKPGSPSPVEDQSWRNWWYIVNPPRRRVLITRTEIVKHTGDLLEGRLGERFSRDTGIDLESRRFFFQVFRVIQKISSPFVITLDRRTRLPKRDPSDPKFRYKSEHWLGFHARRYLRADPRRTIAEVYHPTGDDMTIAEYERSRRSTKRQG